MIFSSLFTPFLQKKASNQLKATSSLCYKINGILPPFEMLLSYSMKNKTPSLKLRNGVVGYVIATSAKSYFLDFSFSKASSPFSTNFRIASDLVSIRFSNLKSLIRCVSFSSAAKVSIGFSVGMNNHLKHYF